MDSQAALILKMDEGVIRQLTAADPSRTLGRLHLEITDRIGTKTHSITLPANDFAGQSVTVNL